MEFIGRTAELARLEREFDKDSLGVVLIYGRRRVGKANLSNKRFGRMTRKRFITSASRRLK